MEDRVEENLAGFVDEEEHDNDEDTPPNSDCEDVERRYMRCKKGSGEIKLEQVFDSIGEFKEVVVDYALKNGENIKFTRWGSEKSEVRCSIGGNCKFKIYCSYEDKIGKYMVKTCNDVHACTKDGFSKVIKSGVLAQLFLNDIRKDPTFKAKAMQDAIEERYTIVATYDQCRTARAKALKMIQEEYDEQFARLHDYMEHLLESNLGLTAEVGNGQYEVLENKHGFKVDMNAKTCACRRWSMTGIPCRHVLRVILTKKHNPKDYVNCDWYLASTNVKIYSESISAVNGIGFWIRSQEPRIQPPPREVTKGPKKTEKKKEGQE
ncbi:PREDICTED: uncharacterized protein LOC104735138 [Camelina sativa]|uniref:Uncharacterized protein LOC104735138 n=1 Tax=Camelina sativa TaxID=90675 RepID=A0ABM0VA15_CAMSA|nr:PREDICTED: uncharacterized protein LOC104735138 [Camelina sativa]